MASFRAIPPGVDIAMRRERCRRQEIGPIGDEQDRRIDQRRPQNGLRCCGQSRSGREIVTPILALPLSAEARFPLSRSPDHGKETGKVRPGEGIPKQVLRSAEHRRSRSWSDLATAMCWVSSTQLPAFHAQVELSRIPGRERERKTSARHRAMPARHHDII